MKTLIYQIDAFTEELFAGNPAAVCPLEAWLSDEMLLSIANENNLSETVFFIPAREGFEIRWFTPSVEVSLCGHATLAAAYVLFSELHYQQEHIEFYSKSGILKVRREGKRILLDFPKQDLTSCDELIASVSAALGRIPSALFQGQDLVAIYEDQAQITELNPDLNALKALPGRGLCVSAPGENTDFVSRWFGPKVGVDEDPVTGSAHCALAPYWGKRLGKTSLQAKQLSVRGGDLECRLPNEERVYLLGHAVKYMAGEIRINK